MHDLVATTIRAPATRLAWAILSAVVVLALPATGGAAQAVPYSLQVNVLTGPQGGLLEVDVHAAAPALPVETLKHVQVSVNGEVIRVLNDVAAPEGVAEVDAGASRPRSDRERQGARSRRDVARARSAPPRHDRAPAAGSRRRRRPRTAADAHDAADRRGRRRLRAERRRRRDRHADADARADAACRAEDGDGAEGRRDLVDLRGREAGDGDVRRADACLSTTRRHSRRMRRTTPARARSR